jgi:LysM repeat protein
MFFSTRKLLVLVSAPLLTQCAMRTAPQSQMVTGPFDSRGNYVEDWVDQPAKWYRPSTPGTDGGSSGNTSVAANTITEPHIPLVYTTSPPEVKSPQAKVTYKSKSKPPAVVRHTVKRGDTLSSLAKRYGSTVSKIQRANGISGSMIRVGQSLKIPK